MDKPITPDDERNIAVFIHLGQAAEAIPVFVAIEHLDRGDGVSASDIARCMGRSTKMVQGRLNRMARWPTGSYVKHLASNRWSLGRYAREILARLDSGFRNEIESALVFPERSKHEKAGGKNILEVKVIDDG